MKNKIQISASKIRRASTQSSKMEGVSFDRAKKNTSLIQTLKRHGRAFSVLRK